MPDFDYVIVGGGMTADAAVRGIRSVDDDGSILLVGEEEEPPYDRPPLSKGLWKGSKEIDDIGRGTSDLDATLRLGRTVVGLDADGKEVVDDTGRRVSFGRLLLATGGSPVPLPDGCRGIHYFRTLDDYRTLRSRVEGSGGRYVIVGGGFIGAEMAAALRAVDAGVVLLFPEEAVGADRFPRGLGLHLNDYYRERGVDVRPGTLVSRVERNGDDFLVHTEGGGALEASGVVAGLGIRPNTGLAEKAGLEVDDGIVVDDELRTSHPEIWAAGDVASFPNPALGERIRVEHEENANTGGMLAGRAMAGEPRSYDLLPFFYSDLFDVGYEAVGRTHRDLEVVEDWAEENRRGVVYYLEDGRVRGVLLWNVRGKTAVARTLVAEEGRFTGDELRGRIDAG